MSNKFQAYILRNVPENIFSASPNHSRQHSSSTELRDEQWINSNQHKAVCRDLAKKNDLKNKISISLLLFFFAWTPLVFILLLLNYKKKIYQDHYNTWTFYRFHIFRTLRNHNIFILFKHCVSRYRSAKLLQLFCSNEQTCYNIWNLYGKDPMK